MTTQEYLQTPETVLPRELIFGATRVADAPLPRHQAAVLDLALALHTHVSERALGRIWISPIDVILDAEQALIVQPDLLFISNERSDILLDRIRGAPDLMVEVLSPNPRIGRLDERLEWFAAYDVRECWLYHQLARRLEIVGFESGLIVRDESFDERTPIRSAVLPEFVRTIGSVFGWDA